MVARLTAAAGRSRRILKAQICTGSLHTCSHTAHSNNYLDFTLYHDNQCKIRIAQTLLHPAATPPNTVVEGNQQRKHVIRTLAATGCDELYTEPCER